MRLHASLNSAAAQFHVCADLLYICAARFRNGRNFRQHGLAPRRDAVEMQFDARLDAPISGLNTAA
jgi:hypothetical protein